MRYLLRKYFIIVLSVYLLIHLIPSFSISGNWQSFLSAVLILSLLLLIVRPIANIILLPINILTLNMAAWLLNIFIIFIWIIFAPNVHITYWEFPGIHLGSIIISPIYLSWWQVVIIIGILLTLAIQMISWLFR